MYDSGKDGHVQVKEVPQERSALMSPWPQACSLALDFLHCGRMIVLQLFMTVASADSTALTATRLHRVEAAQKLHEVCPQKWTRAAPESLCGGREEKVKDHPPAAVRQQLGPFK